jgi:hypothetical protein
MAEPNYIKLREKLLREIKKYDEVGDETMENLEDKYHVDLTSFYGEIESSKDVTRLINKIRKYN